MAKKYKILYISIYLFLNIVGILIALNFWWTDSLTLSYFGKEIAGLLISVAFCWIGVLHLSLLLSRLIFLKNDNYKFIGIWNVMESEHHINDKIDEQTKKTLFKSNFFLGFPIMIGTIIFFILSIDKYERHQLENYGVIEKIQTEQISYDIKQNKYFLVTYNQKNNHTYLSLDNYKVSDTIEIIYSIKNPNIVKYLKDYQ